MTEFDDASFSDYVRAEIAKRDAEIERLNGELAELKKKKGISSATEGLTFNEKTGTHVDASAKHFCTRCLLKDEKRAPLKNGNHGWNCLICTRHYSDPDRPEGPLEYAGSPFP